MADNDLETLHVAGKVAKRTEPGMVEYGFQFAMRRRQKSPAGINTGMFNRWWPHIKFFIVHAKAIAFAGAIWWLIIAMTLDILGAIDIEVDCGVCSRVIDRFTFDALASTTSVPVTTQEVMPPLVSVRIVLLP